MFRRVFALLVTMLLSTSPVIVHAEGRTAASQVSPRAAVSQVCPPLSPLPPGSAARGHIGPCLLPFATPGPRLSASQVDSAPVEALIRMPASQVDWRRPAPQTMPRTIPSQPPGWTCRFDPSTELTTCTFVGSYSPAPWLHGCVGPVIWWRVYDAQGKLVEAGVASPGYGPCPQ